MGFWFDVLTVVSWSEPRKTRVDYARGTCRTVVFEISATAKGVYYAGGQVPSLKEGVNHFGSAGQQPGSPAQ